MNEQFGTWSSEYAGENWPAPNAGGVTLTAGLLTDHVDSYCPLAPPNPCTVPGGATINPVPAYNTSSTTKVQSAPQTWNAGSATPGQGVFLKSDTIQYYLGYGAHN